jgi:hypothetical protein
MTRCVSLRVFTEKAMVDRVIVVRNVGAGPDGTASPLLLADESNTIGSIFEDVPVPDDSSTHAVSLLIKAGSSPLVRIVMAFLGGTPKIYHAAIETRTMNVMGEGEFSVRKIGQGWHRISLAGANNRSGNNIVRVQFYPRWGKPEDTGSVFIVNACVVLRLDETDGELKDDAAVRSVELGS